MSTNRIYAGLSGQTKNNTGVGAVFNGFTQKIYDLFIGIYNQMPWMPNWFPFTWANITGCAFPYTSRLKGHFLLGKYQDIVKNDKALSTEIMKAVTLAEQDVFGRCYFSVGIFASVNWVFIVTKPSDWDQVFIHNKNKVARPSAPLINYVFGEANIMGLPTNNEWQARRKELFSALYADNALENLANTMQQVIDRGMMNISEEENSDAMLGELMVDIIAMTQLGTKHLLKDSLNKIARYVGLIFNLINQPDFAKELAIKKMLEKYCLKSILSGIEQYKHLHTFKQVKNSLFVIILEKILFPHFEDISKSNLFLKKFIKNKKVLPNTQSVFKLSCDDCFNEVILSQAIFLFFMGKENMMPFLKFTIMVLAKHTEVADKIRDEIKSVNENLTFEHIKNMHYTISVLLESQRLYPTIPLGGREVTNENGLVLSDIPPVKTAHEYELAMKNRNKNKDVRLPKGTIVFTATYAAHRDQEIFGENVNEFYPERWLEKLKNRTISIKNFQMDGYYPFGHGDRNCPARAFALTEAALVICHLLKTYDIKLTPETKYPPELFAHSVLLSNSPIAFQFSSREKKDAKSEIPVPIFSCS